jgi:AmmeMemoRadiSam system protein B
MSDSNRPTAVAGTFYPKEPEKLTALLDQFCGQPGGKRRRVPAIVAPHAGYIYSGAIAGEAYRRIEVPQNVLLLCPNHSGKGKRVSVWTEGEWETPLGPLPVNHRIAAIFLQAMGENRGDRDAHLYEHAIEVHLPFIKYLRPNAKIIPVTLGPLSFETCQLVGKAIAAVLSEEPDMLVIASTDMSHYLSAEECTRRDQPALDAIKKVSAEGLYRAVTQNDISMCGFIPTTAVLSACKLLGVKHGEILRYGNSGDTSGDYERVVAYAAALLQ